MSLKIGDYVVILGGLSSKNIDIGKRGKIVKIINDIIRVDTKQTIALYGKNYGWAFNKHHSIKSYTNEEL